MSKEKKETTGVVANEKNEKIKKGVKFSFVIPRGYAKEVFNLAFDSQVVLNYKNLNKKEPYTQMSGKCSEIQCAVMVSEIAKKFEEYIEMLNFIQSFKYSECELNEKIDFGFAVVEPSK